MTAAGFLALSINIALIMILLGLGVAFVRLAIGPSLADRVVALDMMTITIIAFCGVYAVAVDDPSFLDVAIVLALVGFLATVALARYAERRFERDEDQPGGAARKEDDDG
jgi:multicomponent Na+:H+ antiporter subunit F